jgi:hypothetical protein
VDMAWDKTLPGSLLRKSLVRPIVCDLMSEMDAPYFSGPGTWSKEVSVEVFTETRSHSIPSREIESTVQSPIHNEEKCAYHKHDEGYPKCSESK